ncbi:MAG: hypothetical protein AB1295_01910 [Candidatus Micrarchaeota archaeon]
MVQAFSQKPPLEEPSFAALPPITYYAAQDLWHLLSPDSGKRADAADRLKRFGDEKTAQYLENLLLGGNMASEVRSDARSVLLHLSSKYRDFLQDSGARMRRAKAVAIPAMSRTKTPPHGVRALTKA